MFPKKRKFTPTAPTSPPKLPGSLHAKTQPPRPQMPSKEFTKSWKGRVLVRNKTVKKPDRANKTVVWFASEPADDMQNYVVHLIPDKCIFPAAIKARQCLEFELHFHLNQSLPASTKLFVFAALYKAGSKNSAAEEIKEGVMNNFAYVRCTERHCVAVFEKLYLETRSQFSHYLEFSLWFEKPSQQDGLDQYGREMFYPALGANTFQTDNFIPKNTSEVSQTDSVDSYKKSDMKIELIKMVPDHGKCGDTTYLTFIWRGHEKEQSGEIFVVWNDEIIHVPFFGKGHNEKIVVLEKVPFSITPNMAAKVYLKEKTPQDSSAPGVCSNALLYTYTDAARMPVHAVQLLAHQNFNTASSSDGAHSTTTSTRSRIEPLPNPHLRPLRLGEDTSDGHSSSLPSTPKSSQSFAPAQFDIKEEPVHYMNASSFMHETRESSSLDFHFASMSDALRTSTSSTAPSPYGDVLRVSAPNSQAPSPRMSPTVSSRFTFGLGPHDVYYEPEAYGYGPHDHDSLDAQSELDASMHDFPTIMMESPRYPAQVAMQWAHPADIVMHDEDVMMADDLDHDFTQRKLPPLFEA